MTWGAQVFFASNFWLLIPLACILQDTESVLAPFAGFAMIAASVLGFVASIYGMLGGISQQFSAEAVFAAELGCYLAMLAFCIYCITLGALDDAEKARTPKRLSPNGYR